VADLPITEHHLTVARAARYYTAGSPSPALSEVWLVCHGYGQLAQYFLRHFAPLDDGSRLLVAPEGLSRFYLGEAARSHTEARVGASWMTREDRLNEIRDYVSYLDAVCGRVLEGFRSDVRLVGLGFSQGVATVSRWAAMGRTEVDALVLWGERVPPDLDLETVAGRWRGMPLVLVAGTEDPAAPPAVAEQERQRLAQWGIAAEVVAFQGGHQVEEDTLVEVARRLRRSGGAGSRRVP
jgi:predicted esterase